MSYFSAISLGGAALNLGVCTFFFTFVSGRKHLLGTLLSLEGTILILFGILCWINSVGVCSFAYYILVFLTFIACEGALALSLLVIVVRWWGGDRIMALGLLQGN